MEYLSSRSASFALSNANGNASEKNKSPKQMFLRGKRAKGDNRSGRNAEIKYMGMPKPMK